MPNRRKLTDAQAREIGRRLMDGETQQSLADEFGVSRSAISQIARGKSYRRGNGKVRIALTRKRNQRKAERLRSNPPPLPAGEYRCILIDPPWPMARIQRTARPDSKPDFDYPTMQVAEIANLDIPAMLAPDAWVFLWTTQRFIWDSYKIIKGWGLRYRFMMVWHKNGGFQVWNYPAFNGEFIIAAARGKPQFVDTSAFPCVFSAPRGGHSEKPLEFYQMIARTTLGPRLDMFARKAHEGFTVWGNEV